MLLLHILVAVISLAISTYLIARPSKQLLNVSYGLIALTSLTGVALMAMSPAYVLRGCMAYVTYSVIVLALSSYAKKSLRVDI